MIQVLSAGQRDDRLLSTEFLFVKAVSALYVIAIPLSHFALPHGMIWEIAVFFLIAMLFTYPIAAIIQKKHVVLEVGISCVLAALGIAGLLMSMPTLIILAIFAHGVWDIAKHYGIGCKFFSWYVLGCVTVDWFYAAALATFYVTIGGVA